MKITNIGVMSPGDMGQAVAQQLKLRGYHVCTALDQRSARSRTLAREAGLTDVGTIAQLTEQCEVILSIMNPAAAHRRHRARQGNAGEPRQVARRQGRGEAAGGSAGEMTRYATR